MAVQSSNGWNRESKESSKESVEHARKEHVRLHRKREVQSVGVEAVRIFRPVGDEGGSWTAIDQFGLGIPGRSAPPATTALRQCFAVV